MRHPSYGDRPAALSAVWVVRGRICIPAWPLQWQRSQLPRAHVDDGSSCSLAKRSGWKFPVRDTQHTQGYRLFHAVDGSQCMRRHSYGDRPVPRFDGSPLRGN